MSLYKQFENNEKVENEGIWIDYPENEDGTTPAFKISRMYKGNKKYSKTLNKAIKPHKRAIQLETLSEKASTKLMLGVFVNSIVLDWRNVQNEEGETMQFSKENAVKLFEDLPELYDDLEENSKKLGLFRSDELEEDSKN